MTIIGIDPHPQTHTAAALDSQGRLLGVETFPSGEKGVAKFMEWLVGMDEVRVAVEGPSQPFFAVWLTRLLAEEVPVYPVPAQQVRQRRGRRKTDEEDAVLIATVLHTSREWPAPFDPPGWLVELREMSRTRQRLASQLQADRMRLRVSRNPAAQASLERVVKALAGEVAELERAIGREVRRRAPRLMKLRGVKAVVGGILLSETGDTGRFKSADHFASYCGAAPVPWESGAGRHVRVNRGGNRRLNYALHIIARTRLRTDEATKILVQRKEGEGKTHREAIRILKTHLARQIYGVLRTLAPHQQAQAA